MGSQRQHIQLSAWMLLATASSLALAQLCCTSQAQAPATQPVAAAAPYLNAYAVPDGIGQQAEAWAAKFQSPSGERVAYDGRTNQLLVMGTEPLHRFVADMLTRAAQAQVAPAAAQAPPSPVDDAILPVASAQQPTARAVAAGKRANIALNNLTGGELHKRLEKVLGKPIQVAHDATSGRTRFVAELVPGSGVIIEMQPAGRQLTLTGAEGQVSAWERVISAIDTGAIGGDQVTQLVATKSTPKPTLQRTFALLGGREQEDGRVTMVMQPGDAVQDGGQPDETGEQPGPGTTIIANPVPEDGDSDTSLVAPVQIEFIEGLDIIIVTGNPRDVAIVMKIIGQIEQTSVDTLPTIEVLPLEHVESKPMAALLERVYTQVLGARTGTVSITPLVKPNALLLIGREENVKTAIDLVKRVDQPVEPTTRFEVFPLQHATASAAKTLLDEFLANQEDAQAGDDDVPTLAPKALVVADTRTNSLVVSAGPRDMVEIREVIRKIDLQRGGAVDQVRVFKLKNTLAEDLAGVLREAITGDAEGTGTAEEGARQSALELVNIDPLNQQSIASGILSNVRIAADAPNNSLVVTAPQASMELIAALIDQLDRVPEAKAELKVFTIVNGDAIALQEMLQSLFGTEEDQDVGSIGAGENPLIRLQLSVDARTNSIIAAGTADDLSVVEAILQTLDASDVLERETKVYRLKNAFSIDVATTLNEWLVTEREAEANAELAISPIEQIKREVIIVPDQASNSLVVSATPKYYDKIARLVEQLDEQPPMVNIQVLIAEVRLNDTDEFGVELGLQDSLLFDRSVIPDPVQTITTTTQQQSAGGANIATITEQTIINAPLSPGFNFGNPSTPLGNNGSTNALANAGNVAGQALSSFGVNRVNSELGFGGFVFSASSNSVSMLLRALQENRRLEILSRPQIVALDNQPGEIRVGQRVPTITSVNTTDFGQNNTIEYQDAGIILQVTPRINKDGLVVMTVYAEKSLVGDPAEGVPIFAGIDGTVINSPRIDQIVAQTTVAAMTGQTVVLSGLLTKSTSDVHRRVPLLSDIPLLGDLFRYDSVSEQRTELLIILTPRVIRSELDAEMIKQVESSRMSWVLCDVIDLHGPSGLKSRCDEWSDAETEAVYPTDIPNAEELMSPQPVYEGVPVEQGPQWMPESNRKPASEIDRQVVPTSFESPQATPLRQTSRPTRLPPVQ